MGNAKYSIKFDFYRFDLYSALIAAVLGAVLKCILGVKLPKYTYTLIHFNTSEFFFVFFRKIVNDMVLNDFFTYSNFYFAIFGYIISPDESSKL